MFRIYDEVHDLCQKYQNLSRENNRPRLFVADRPLARLFTPETDPGPILRRADEFDAGRLEGFLDFESGSTIG